MTRKHKVDNPRISAEGNNGGDILEIELLGDNLIRLELGHCCIKTVNHIVPVEFVTAVLTQAIIQAGGIEQAMRSIQWSPDYVERLVNQIKDVSITAKLNEAIE